MGKILVLSAKQLLKKREEKALTEAGWQVAVSHEYNESRLRTNCLHSSVIVLDDTLRGIDVNETCRKLRALSRATIILLGSLPPAAMWEKCKEIGFDHYFKKPLSSRELAYQIKRVMEWCEPAADTPASGLNSAPSPETESDVEIDVVKESRQEAAPENTPGIWQEPRVANLMSAFLKNKINSLSPQIDLSLGEGFSYREAEEIMGTSPRETALILDSLAKEGLLLKQDFEKILVSPSGSVQLLPVERCPACDSSQLTRGQLIEHFACGHIGLEEEFMHGLNQICPKCRRELKLIGTDYRKPGLRYICGSCHGVFPAPVIKCRCLKTGEIYRLEELEYVPLSSYSLNESSRKRLEFELEPKKRLIEYLDRLGYEVKESVQVKGRSGATHKIDIVAGMDDLITRHTVAIGILAAPREEGEVPIDPLFNFDSKIYDAGIDSKMVIAVPRFSREAMKFAERQGIRVYGLEDLKVLLAGKARLMEFISVKKEKRQVRPGNGPDVKKSDPRGQLKWLLENRGYTVSEKVKVTGRSGADHILDLYAHKDDGVINHKVAACVILNEDVFGSDVNEVMQFDTAAYDASIRDKVLVSVAALSKEARQFAEYQRIKIISVEELADLASRQAAGDAARDLSMLLKN
ncbi:MAG: restriction endonuclease [Dehalococcoidales bacterium]|nr:restriction endonuclease [Dehalococcoidales bacterium]